MMLGELIMEHSMPTWVIVTGLSLAVVLGVFSFLRYMSLRLSNLLLLALRLLFLALLGWCMFQPQLKHTLTETIKPRFLVVVDTSTSMTMIPAPTVATSRWAVAQQVLKQSWTKRVQSECQVDLFTFDVTARPPVPFNQASELVAQGPSTHLRENLRAILNRYRGQNLEGMLLLSDGLDTKEVHDDWAAETWPCPIYTVRLEPPVTWEVEPDVHVDTVDTPRRVVVGWDTKLTATVSGQGAKNTTFNVVLLKDGNPVDEVPTQLPPEGGSRELSFRLEHPVVGSFEYTVYVPPLPKETRTNDNAFAVSVLVVDTKNRILFVESVPRWESKFLIRTLKANKNITPLSFIRGPDNKFITFGERGGMTLDMTEEQLKLYKIILLGDLDSEALGEQRATALLKFVENGGSMVIVGGPKAWGVKGLQTTALRRLLPFQRAWETPQKEGTFAVTLTDEGRTHAVFTSGTNSWEKLPPVLSLFSVTSLSPGAMSLVAAQTPQGSEPILISQKFGQGKVTVVLTDSLWRWQMDPGQNTTFAFTRFWTQMIEWLSPSEVEVEKYELDLFSDMEQLFMGETIALKARLNTAGDVAPAPNLKVFCEIRKPDQRTLTLDMAPQTVTVPSGKSYPGYALEYKAEAAGLHKAIARVEVEGKTIQSSPYSFFIKSFTPETNPRAFNVELLKALSQNSGGRFLEPHEVDKALAALKVKTSEEQRVEFKTLWNLLLVIACLMALLSIEWIIRKTRNLP